MYVVAVDTTQIQSYVFASNRLRENIGGSHLVARATRGLSFEALNELGLAHNVTEDGVLDDSRRIEDGNIGAEVVYADGGNIVVLFALEKDARAFERVLSVRALETSPGLQLVTAVSEFDWFGGPKSLATVVDESFGRLTEEKRSRPLSSPLLGLGVTRACNFTGLPGVKLTDPLGTDPSYPASAEIHAKLGTARPRGQEYSEADLRLRGLLNTPAGYDFPTELDHLGRSAGEHSYIAVIHADGNGMAQRIGEITNWFGAPAQNRQYITVMRRFSKAIADSVLSAVRSTLNKLNDKIDKKEKAIIHRVKTRRSDGTEYERETGRIDLKSDGRKTFLPFRPLVLAGDDVTFVTDGRLGLSLAVYYLREAERHSEIELRRLKEELAIPLGVTRLTSCAGVSIVKSHYPFARAYALAEELCQKAKSYRRELNREPGGWDGSCLDWHFTVNGLSSSLDEVRKKEYSVPDGSLTLRPVTLSENRHEPYRSWEVELALIKAFQGTGWSGRRINKVKTLRGALREGRHSVEGFLKAFSLDRLPRVAEGHEQFETTGWWGSFCGYFDAVELADSFIPLEEVTP